MQGATAPSQTAAGAGGVDSGPTPAPATAAMGGGGGGTPATPYKPDRIGPDGQFYALVPPEEREAKAQSVAKVQADAARIATNQQLDDTVKTIQQNDPEAYKDNKDEIDRAVLAKKLGVVLPDETKGALQAKYLHLAADAYKAGNKALGDSYKSLSEDKPDLSGDFPVFAAGYKARHPQADGVEISNAYNNDKAQIASQYNKPPQPKTTQWVVPDGKGGHKQLTLSDGDAVPEGAVSATQYGSTSVAAAKDATAPLKEATAAKNAYNEGSQYAAMQNGPGDVALIMQVMSQVKPENIGKIRFNKAEQDFLIKARSAPDALQARLDGIRSGNLLGKQERQQYMDVLGTIAHAKAREAGLEDASGKPVGVSGGTPSGGTLPASPKVRKYNPATGKLE